MVWKTLDTRLGYFGKKRDEIYEQHDDKFGKGNWRIRWRWGDTVIDYLGACKHYEDAYYKDSFNREDCWRQLIKDAREVYDTEESNVGSGFDYTAQEGDATHIQDIAIRRVVSRRCWKFEGDELVQIRSHQSYWGDMLSPGKVKFHKPEMIAVPHLEGWWEEDSVEDFYQSNKVIQVKE